MAKKIGIAVMMPVMANGMKMKIVQGGVQHVLKNPSTWRAAPMATA